jgi:DNA segregation ATPase FtsK/SpoIIIE, S-DNA-T family
VEDTQLFYYSGHGEPLGRDLYLCGADSESKSLRSTAISTDELSKMITDTYAAAVIILLDCCYSGSFGDL